MQEYFSDCHGGHFAFGKLYQPTLRLDAQAQVFGRLDWMQLVNLLLSGFVSTICLLNSSDHLRIFGFWKLHVIVLEYSTVINCAWVATDLRYVASNFTFPSFVLFYSFIVALCAVSLLNVLGPHTCEHKTMHHLDVLPQFSGMRLRWDIPLLFVWLFSSLTKIDCTVALY